MIFMIGGCCSGKTEYANSLQKNPDMILDNLHLEIREAMENIMQKADRIDAQKVDVSNEKQDFVNEQDLINEQDSKEIESLVRVYVQKKVDELLLKETCDSKAIVVGLEMGDGVVPMDYKERLYREINGRINCQIAQMADTVYLMECGIPLKIKGGL